MVSAARVPLSRIKQAEASQQHQPDAVLRLPTRCAVDDIFFEYCEMIGLLVIRLF